MVPTPAWFNGAAAGSIGALSLAFIAAWTTEYLAVPHLERMGLSPAVIGDRAPEDAQCLALPEIRPELSPLFSTIPPTWTMTSSRPATILRSSRIVEER